ncbi:hypothetical protein Tco_0961368 [Tanacetum coccineum]
MAGWIYGCQVVRGGCGWLNGLLLPEDGRWRACGVAAGGVRCGGFGEKWRCDYWGGVLVWYAKGHLVFILEGVVGDCSWTCRVFLGVMGGACECDGAVEGDWGRGVGWGGVGGSGVLGGCRGWVAWGGGDGWGMLGGAWVHIGFVIGCGGALGGFGVVVGSGSIKGEGGQPGGPDVVGKRGLGGGTGCVLKRVFPGEG